MSTTGNGQQPVEPNFDARLAAFGNRTVRRISPPPLRRPAYVSRIERFAVFRRPSSTSTGNDTETSQFPAGNHAGSAVISDVSRSTTPAQPPMPSPRPETPASNGTNATRRAQAEAVDWTVPTIVTRLESCRKDIREGHSRLTGYILESTKAAERRVHNGADLFANVQSSAIAEEKGTTMRIKFKPSHQQHLKNKRDHREVHYKPLCTKTDRERVPRYRFHHVEIRKNILTPNTMLTFVPHLRDLESSEETKYNLWLKELEEIDTTSGFKPMNREDKQRLTIQGERAATVSLYLDTWLEDMAIPGCNKSALISYMAVREPDNAITPQQKTDILMSHRDDEIAAPEANQMAKMFTDAFHQVFSGSLPAAKRIELRRVLLLDESVDNIMDSKPIVKDGTSLQNDDEDEDELAESNLATYCILGCLVCFSHSCDHGEYDNKNMKRTFSISSCSHLSRALKGRRRRRANSGQLFKPCRRQCYKQGGEHVPTHVQARPFSEDETIVLRSIFTTANHSTYRGDPICLAAEFLNRNCDEVHKGFKSLGISLPQPEPLTVPRVKALSWYDRRRKLLLGDWQDHTISHAHQRRENLEPCFHEGPCAPGKCSCVDAGVLCEKFCGCTVEDCAYKFTGCGCHSQGKTCQQNKKDKPCICVQLNRECDPQLCGSCGALERADPLKAHAAELHATGCQNCDLQRGVGKSLVLGQSQLEGVGYGLFTAEDIAQDEFIIEYVGELITHDEGVRREARRGDVFDEESNVSYVFTLLDSEGTWVDAAIYGNLSRYINHASEHDTRGCNITPRILYVNGEYRIKFTAMRDIAAGEELFFNYGENFPNLTKKLLDDKAASRKPDVKTRGSRTARRADNEGTIARKTSSKAEQKRRPGRPRVKRDLPPGFALAEADADRGTASRKRKRRFGDAVDADHDAMVVSREPAVAAAAVEVGRDSEESGSASASASASATRLRKRTRKFQPETPTRRIDASKKTRGKRGGARPGSGRPRKHPRPVSQPAASEFNGDSALSSQSSTPTASVVAATTTTTTTMTTTTTTASTKAVASSSSKTTSTPEGKRVTRRSERMDVIEIEDSDDAGVNGSATLFSSGLRRDAKMTTTTTATPTVTQKDDDDEDQDILVRQRSARATRTRRPPAKLRDDDIWM